jgi:hypothetical protein
MLEKLGKSTEVNGHLLSMGMFQVPIALPMSDTMA